MKVFNLTAQPVTYKSKTIAPYGVEEVNISFIPDRDRKLASAGILAFGSLPKGWKKPNLKAATVKKLKDVGVAAITQTLKEPGLLRQAMPPVEISKESVPAAIEDSTVESSADTVKTESSYKKKRY